MCQSKIDGGKRCPSFSNNNTGKLKSAAQRQKLRLRKQLSDNNSVKNKKAITNKINDIDKTLAIIKELSHDKDIADHISHELISNLTDTIDVTESELRFIYADTLNEGFYASKSTSDINSLVEQTQLPKYAIAKMTPAQIYALSRLEDRARSHQVVKSVAGLVTLDPPGSHSANYERDEHGRPAKVWYASYGSNVFRDRMMIYVKGGSPEGSIREYPGCRNNNEPDGDIVIQYPHALHFGLNSKAWGGGVGFMDKESSSSSLGRAYLFSSEQFDDILSQEAGNGITEEVTDTNQAIDNGSYATAPNAYGTLVHVGDRDGAPVLTFTSPISRAQALQGGHIVEGPNNTQSEFMVNKPTGPYLSMMAKGMKEAFGLNTDQQIDYIKGMQGSEEWTRKELRELLTQKDS